MGDVTLSSGTSRDIQRALLISHLVVEHGATVDDINGGNVDLTALKLLHDTWDVTDEDESDFHIGYDGEGVVITVTTGDIEESYTVTPEVAFALGVELLANAGIAAALDRALTPR